MRGSPLNNAVLKVTAAKKRMDNVLTIERNDLFKRKFDVCKGDLKTTFKIVYQLLNKAHCSNFLSQTNQKTLVTSFKKIYTNKVKNRTNNFKRSSTTLEFKTRKQLIKHPLEHFTEVTDDDMIKIAMDLANKQSVLDARPFSFFKQLLPVLLPS